MVKANVRRLLHLSSKHVHTHASTAFSQYCYRKSNGSVATLLKKAQLACFHTRVSAPSEQSENDKTQSGKEVFPFEGWPSRKKRVQDLEKALERIKRATEHKIGKNDSADGDRFYTISSEDGLEYVFPSVTTILSRTLPPKNYYSLKNWKKNIVSAVGEEGYKMVRLKATSSGSSFHHFVEQRLTEKAKIVPISIRPYKKAKSLSHSPHMSVLPAQASMPQLEPSALPLEKQQLEGKESSEDLLYLRSLDHVLKDISEVYALESVVRHLQLGYAGTVDCIGKYKGENCVIDWKTSSRPKPSLDDCFDFPLQVVAYAGAVNQDENYPFKIYNALIVVAYPNGEPAHAHFLAHEQCKYYWQQWTVRVEEFHTQCAHDLSNVYL